MTSQRSTAEFKQQELVFQTPNGKTLTVNPMKLTLVMDGDSVIACQLVFSVTPEALTRIRDEKLFHIKSSLSLPSTHTSDAAITIEVALDPRIAPDLATGASNAAEAQALLVRMSHDEPGNPLMASQSWLAKAVKSV